MVEVATILSRGFEPYFKVFGALTALRYHEDLFLPEQRLGYSSSNSTINHNVMKWLMRGGYFLYASRGGARIFAARLRDDTPTRIQLKPLKQDKAYICN